MQRWHRLPLLALLLAKERQQQLLVLSAACWAAALWLARQCLWLRSSSLSSSSLSEILDSLALQAQPVSLCE
jgi:hypothetical protein